MRRSAAAVSLRLASAFLKDVDQRAKPSLRAAPRRHVRTAAAGTVYCHFELANANLANSSQAYSCWQAMMLK